MNNIIIDYMLNKIIHIILLIIAFYLQGCGIYSTPYVLEKIEGIQ